MPEAEILMMLLSAAVLAGWVDAIVGGGGLIQIPALLLVPGMTPVHAIATNKVASSMGTAVAAKTYQKRVGLPHGVLWTMFFAFLASVTGALAATHLPTRAFTVLIIVALVIVLLVTVLRPNAFAPSSERAAHPRHSTTLRVLVLGTVMGFYDGVMGAGTGSFLLLGLVLVIGMEVLPATALAKTVNLATNLGALALFTAAGTVQWRTGLLMGCANMLGGWLGARTATRLGPRLVRVILIIVVLALLGRLVHQQIR